MNKRRLVVGVFAVIDVAVLAVLVVLLVMNGMKTATVDIVVAPSTARVTINGKEYRNGEAYRIEPGELNVVIENEGLQTKALSVEAKSNEITKIYDYLTSEDGSFGWYEDNLTEIETLRRMTYDEDVNAFIKRMDIAKILPYHYVAYDDEKDQYVKFTVEVDTIDCPNSFCLQALKISESTNDFIKSKMKEKGYNLDDYTVYYY